ncbi:MAG TPA: protein kinase [Thermoanaerobaculia bacterium]|nr:protein kinase [Thermoanaerobaculia bacterium]
MTLAAGSRLGPYEILAPLGVGGMGEVYRAQDTRLGREVAVKVLPAELSSDASRLKRFEKEARSVSALNHPNIVTIYDIGTVDSIPYIAMERVEGSTLREMLFGGPLPIRKLLQIAPQIAEGIAKAHEAGIVHRDLKPENVMVSRQGIVKILDFGLAKLIAGGLGIDGDGALPTTTGTRPGVVMGTVGYMSPEQASAGAVDYRSDQFSMGSILYEMATGKRAFQKKTGVETLAAVLNEEPEPIGQVNPKVPAPLRWVIERCLAKEPENRFASTKDLARDLANLRDRVTEVSGSGETVSVPRRVSRRLLWLFAAAAVVVTTAISIARWRTSPATPGRIHSSLLPPEELGLADTAPVAVSPDGSRIVFGAGNAIKDSPSLFLRVLSEGTSQRLPETVDALFPFWSPDGKSVGFFQYGKLKSLDVAGGTPKTVCDAPAGNGGTWGPEGVILFAPNSNGPIHRVAAAGGEPTPVTELDSARHEYGHRWPQFLPDGKHFFFEASSTPGNRKASIRIGSLDSKETRVLTEAASTGKYAPPGYVLFVDARGKLVAQPFAADRLETKGPAVPLAEDVWLDESGGPACFSVSRDGLLVCQTNTQTARLTWFDRHGKQGECLGQWGENWGPRLSPDGKKVAAQMRANGIWIGELSRGLGTRVSAGQWPVWSPDGRQIAFSLNGDLYVKTASGTDEPRLLLHSVNELGPDDWSPDGRFLLYEDHDPKTSADLWVLPLEGDRKPRPFLRTEANEDVARFSPDGRWVAYDGEGGMYVLPFPGPGDRWKVTSSGGHPAWSRDGKELFYIDNENLMSVQVVVAGSSIRTGEPSRLFQRPAGEQYDVSADGKQFLFTVLNETARPDPITLVQNWVAGFKQ